MAYPLIPTNRFEPKDGEVSDEDLDAHGLVRPGEETTIKHKKYRDGLVDAGLGINPNDDSSSKNDGDS